MRNTTTLLLFGLIFVGSYLNMLKLADASHGNCAQQKYGRNCELTCHCANNDTCNKHTGQCPGACEPGWYNETCQMENIALSKAVKGSQYIGDWYRNKAVDGDTSTCFHARRGDPDQWLEVDLGSPRTVREVWIRNYAAVPSRLQQVTVTVGQYSRSTGTPTQCYYHGPPDIGPTSWLKKSCNGSTTGRFVSVSRGALNKDPINVGPLTMCELAVFADREMQIRPEAVQSIGSNSLTSTTAQIAWSQPEYSNLLISQYKVSLYKIHGRACPGSAHTRTFVSTTYISKGKMYFDFGDLYPYTEYEAEVTAVTAATEGGGEGTPRRYRFNTTAGSVSGDTYTRPQSLTMVNVTSRSVYIKWNNPECDKWAAPFHRYKIIIATAGKRDETRFRTQLLPTEYTVNDLLPYTSYRIFLHFRTTGKISADRNIDIVTLSEKPDKPTSISLSTGQHWNVIQWSRPTNNGQLQGFAIRLKLDSESGCPNSSQSPTKVNVSTTLNSNTRQYQHTLSDFRPGSQYTIAIATINDWGVGSYGTWSGWTAARAPDRPTNLDGSLVNNTAATFSWRGPDCKNFRGTNHRYRYEIKGVSQGFQFHKNGETPGTSVTVTGVGPGKSYELTVCTKNNGNSNSGSVLSTILLDEREPGAPTEIQMADHSNASVIITWNPPIQPNGIITGYKVQCNETISGSIIAKENLNGSASRSYTAAGLQPAHDYHCLVQANNSKGYGETGETTAYTKPSGVAGKEGVVIKKFPKYCEVRFAEHLLHLCAVVMHNLHCMGIFWAQMGVEGTRQQKAEALGYVEV